MKLARFFFSRLFYLNLFLFLQNMIKFTNVENEGKVLAHTGDNTFQDICFHDFAEKTRSDLFIFFFDLAYFILNVTI